jgi:hypothetical protein
MEERECKQYFLTLLLASLLILPGVVAQVLTSDSVAPGDNGFSGQWVQVTPGAAWSERCWHCSVVLPDNSIVLMGGMDTQSERKNDVWRSTDNGLTWTMQTANAGWSGRFGQNCVALPDGSIVLMGGSDRYLTTNDTWRSTDKGETWTLVNASPGWTERRFASSVVLPDDTIILMGGFEDEGVTEKNDIWKSEDRGATWQLVNANAAWIPRRSHSSVALQDGTIVVMGGFNLKKYSALDDTWTSTDYGVSWKKANSGTWPSRYDFNSIVLPDDRIVLIGGTDFSTRKNDVWQSSDKGTTWHIVNARTIWTARWGHSGIVTKDGSIIVMGGSTKDWQNGGMNDIWKFEPEGSLPLPSSGRVLVTRVISPNSIKQGTDSRVTITVTNGGSFPVHDVEILDTTLPEFPVMEGTLHYSAPMIEPNDTRIITYDVHATKPGSYRFNRTTVMFADNDGNYHVAYSDYTKIEVLAPLAGQGQDAGGNGGLVNGIIDWIKGLGKIFG